MPHDVFGDGVTRRSNPLATLVLDGRVHLRRRFLCILQTRQTRWELVCGSVSSYLPKLGQAPISRWPPHRWMYLLNVLFLYILADDVWISFSNLLVLQEPLCWTVGTAWQFPQSSKALPLDIFHRRTWWISQLTFHPNWGLAHRTLCVFVEASSSKAFTFSVTIFQDHETVRIWQEILLCAHSAIVSLLVNGLLSESASSSLLQPTMPRGVQFCSDVYRVLACAHSGPSAYSGPDAHLPALAHT